MLFAESVKFGPWTPSPLSCYSLHLAEDTSLRTKPLRGAGSRTMPISQAGKTEAPWGGGPKVRPVRLQLDSDLCRTGLTIHPCSFLGFCL